ncbi:MAG: hypothetical protein ABIQ95_13275 [Bdellovibrionia bacterium]
MKFDRASAIAKTLLYEGYNLYPYQAHSIKNQQRWTFGGLLPSSFVDAQNKGDSDQKCFQTECLVRGNSLTKISIVIRFLHLIDRTLVKPDGSHIDSIKIEDRVYYPWEEHLEREVVIPETDLGSINNKETIFPFYFGSTLTCEPLSDSHGFPVGSILRNQCAVQGAITLLATWIQDQTYKLTVQVENKTPFAPVKLEYSQLRSLALKHSLISAHTLLGTDQGEFISLLDPATELVPFVADCKNIGTFPVLAGKAGDHDVMLSSPIILYDYPEIAPESRGDFFDGTEIDEMLILRIQTLTDEEKTQMRSIDEHTRSLLERTESICPDSNETLQGRLRYE